MLGPVVNDIANIGTENTSQNDPYKDVLQNEETFSKLDEEPKEILSKATSI